MSAGTQVSLSEYLSTSYEPECEYIDGVLEDRHAGLRLHGQTVGRLSYWLISRESQHRQATLMLVRVQVSRSRVRVPDICLTPADDTDEIVQHPPALWVEVLCPEDQWAGVWRKLDDALQFGVPMLWIIDPYERQAWMATRERGAVQVEDDVLRCEDLSLEVGLTDILPED